MSWFSWGRPPPESISLSIDVVHQGGAHRESDLGDVEIIARFWCK